MILGFSTKKLGSESESPPFLHQLPPSPHFTALSSLSSKTFCTCPQVTQFSEGPTPPPQGSNYETLFNFQRILCKKKSEAVSMLIWTNFDSYDIKFNNVI